MRSTPQWAATADLLGQLLSPRAETTHERWKSGIRSGTTLADLVARRLLAKKFRKSPLDAPLISRVTRTVSHCLDTDAPLRIFVPFGGYKSPASPEFPWAGWAELFAVAGLAAVVAPICEFHPAGAIVEFSSDELIVPRLTGAPRPVLDRYRADFDRVLSCARPYLPPNLSLRQSFLRDAYDEAELTRMISGLGRHLAEEWFPGLSRHHQERLLRSAANNRFRTAGTHAPAQLSELRRTVCEHQAFLEVDDQCRSAVFADRCTIPVALRRGLAGWLHLGSNHRSATQFWIGFGVVDTLRSPAAHILPPGRAAAVLPGVRYVPTPGTDVHGLTHLPVTAGIPR
jgi:hypothetical protein